MKDICKKLAIMSLLCTMLFNPIVSYAVGEEASKVGSLSGGSSSGDGSSVQGSGLSEEDEKNLVSSTDIEVDVESSGNGGGSGIQDSGKPGDGSNGIVSANELTGTINGTSGGTDLDKFTKLLDDSIWLSSSEMEESPTGKRKLYKYGIRNASDRDGVLGTKLVLNYSGISSDIIDVYVLIGNTGGYEKLTPYSDSDGQLVYYLKTWNLNAKDRVGYALNINVESVDEYKVTGVFSARLWATNESKTSMQIFGEPDGDDMSNTLTTDEDIVESPEISNKFVVKVTLKDDEGNIISEQEIDRGSQLVKPLDPTREGYLFDNWYNNDEIFDFGQDIFENIELIAKFKKVWNVTFCYNNGLENNSIKVIDGDKIDKPEDPVSNIEGKFFSNWFYTDKDIYDFDMPVISDLVINARYAGKVTITLDTGEGYKVDDIEIVEGSPLPELPVPNYIDGIFNHWEDDNGNIVDKGDIIDSGRLVAVYDYLGDYAWANMSEVGSKSGYQLIRLKEKPSDLSSYIDCGWYRQHNWSGLRRPTRSTSDCITEVPYYGISKYGWMGTKVIPTNLFSPVYYKIDDIQKKIEIYSSAKYICFSDGMYGWGIDNFGDQSSYERVKAGLSLNFKDEPRFDLKYPGRSTTGSGAGTVTRSNYAHINLFCDKSNIDLFDCIIGVECQDFHGYTGEVLDLSKIIFSDFYGRHETSPKFGYCPNLKEIIYPYFRDNKLMDMQSMFCSDSNLEYIDLTVFDLEIGKNIKNYEGSQNFQNIRTTRYLYDTFNGCSNLKEIRYPDDFIEIYVESGCAVRTYRGCSIDKFPFGREDMEWMLDDDTGYEYSIYNPSTYDPKLPVYATKVTRLKFSNITDSAYQRIPGTYRSLKLTGIPYFDGKNNTSNLDGVTDSYVKYPIYRRNSLEFAFRNISNGQYMTNHTDPCYDIIGAIDKDGSIVDVNYLMTLECTLQAIVKAKEGCLLPGPDLYNIWNGDALYLKMSNTLISEAIDISLRQDGSIMTWYDDNNKTQYIYSNLDTIYINTNGYKTFSSLVNCKYMDLSRLSTKYCMTLEEMFFGCTKLEKVEYGSEFVYVDTQYGDIYKKTWPINLKYDVLPETWVDVGYHPSVGASAFYYNWREGNKIQLYFRDMNGGYYKIFSIGNARSLRTIMSVLPEYEILDDTYRFIGWSSSSTPTKDTLIDVDKIVYDYNHKSVNFYALVERVGVSISGNLVGNKIRENFNVNDIIYFRKGLYKPDSNYVDISLSSNESLLLYMDGNTLCWYSDNDKFIVTGTALSMFSNLTNIIEMDFTDVYLGSVYVTASMFYNCSNLTNIIYGDTFINGDAHLGSYYYDYYNSQYGTGNYAAYMFYNCPANKPETYKIGRFDANGTYMADKYNTITIYYGLPNISNQSLSIRYGYTLPELNDDKLKIEPPDDSITFLGWYCGNDLLDENYPIIKSINITAKWSRPGYLETGQSFNSKINSKATKVAVSENEPVGITTIDCSQFKDGSVVTWFDSSSFTQYIYSYNGNVIMSEDCSNMFKSKSRLVSIDLNGIDFQYVQNMSYMFYGCTMLSDLDCSLIVANNLLNLSNMFYNCYKLTDLDLSGFTTNNVTDYKYMFYNCTLLNNIIYGDLFNISDSCNISVLNSNNGTYCMFYNCKANKPDWNPGRFGADGTYVDGLNLSLSFNVNKPSDMSVSLTNPTSVSVKFGYSPNECGVTLPVLGSSDGYKFIGWYSHATNPVSSIIKVAADTPVLSGQTLYARWERTGYVNIGSKVAAGIYNNSKYTIFKQSSTPPAATVDSSYITDVSLMGDGSVVVWRDDTQNAILWYSKSGKMVMSDNANGVFYGKNYLTNISLKNMDFSKSTNLGSLFGNCNRLTSIDFAGMNTGMANRIDYMFSGCSALTNVNLSQFNFGNVLNASYLFNNCSNLTSVNMSNVVLPKANNLSYMFYRCSKITNIDIRSVVASNNTFCNYMFSDCTALTTVNISGLDTRKVTNFGYMFYRCGNLSSITYGSNFKPDAGTNFTYMFRYSNNAPKPSNWTGTWNGYNTYTK